MGENNKQQTIRQKLKQVRMKIKRATMKMKFFPIEPYVSFQSRKLHNTRFVK